MAFAPVFRCLVSDAVTLGRCAHTETPIQEESESCTEPTDLSEALRGEELSRRSYSRVNRNRHPLLSRIRIDQAAILPSVVNASASSSELRLRNGCGATLRC